MLFSYLFTFKMDRHQEIVNKCIDELSVNTKYDAVLAHLKDKSVKVNAHFKSWVKKKGYEQLDCLV